MTEELITNTVPPDRLAWGRWNHETGHEEGEGDVIGSYSADLIGGEGRVRKPFQYDGQLWVTVSICQDKAEAYRIVPLQLFAGPTTTYRDKVEIENGDAARADPNGFYHAMKVVCGRQEYAMRGPPVVFVADGPSRPAATPLEQAQLEMF